jgi:hypothetical protein
MGSIKRRAFSIIELLVVMGILATFGLLFVMFVGSSGCGSHNLANRSACGASLTGICKALNLYAAENNDQFPAVRPPAVVGHYNNQPVPSAKTAEANAVLASYYTKPYAQAGDPLACLWMLVLKGNVGPKQFRCHSDPSIPTPSDQTDSSGNFYDNFGAVGASNCISYSFAYPWTRKPDGTTVVGKWWTSTVDSTLAIGADMAPLTGRSGKDVTASLADVNAGRVEPKVFNSANHEGEGQNVVFADTHVEWMKSPYVEPADDNIWTIGSGAGQTAIKTPGVTPVPPYVPDAAATSAPASTTPRSPFDVIMVPVRDAATGKL